MGATKIDVKYFKTGEFKIALTEIRAKLELVKNDISSVTSEDFVYNDELNQVIEEITNADELAGKLRNEMYEFASNWECAESLCEQIVDNLNYNSSTTYQSGTSSSTNISNSTNTYYYNTTSSTNTENTSTTEKVSTEDTIQNENNTDSTEKIEANSIYGENATQYGGDQSDVSSGEFLDDPQMKSIIEKYYGNVSEEEMEELLNTCTSKGCGYVAMINTLFYEYNRI